MRFRRQAAGYTESPDGGRRSQPAPPRPRSDRLGGGANPGAARPRPEPFRARGLLAPLVGALRLQALGAAAARPAVGRRARPAGPGRERRRPRPRRRPRGRVQGRVAQPPVRGRAVPGCRDRASAGSSATSSRWARGRSRSSTASGSASPTAHFERAVARHRPLRQLRRRPERRRRDRLRRGLRGNCLVNAMCVGLLDASACCSAKAQRPRQRSSSSTARRPGRDGIGGASVLASQELGRTTRSARRFRSATRSRGKKLIEVSLELVEPGLVESLQDCGAAGLASVARRDGVRRRRHRRPPRPRAAARGGHGAVGDHDLGVAGADGRGRRAGDARRGARAVRALGAAVRVIGEVTGTGRCARSTTSEVVGEIPARLLTDECPRYEVEQRSRTSRAGAAAPAQGESDVAGWSSSTTSSSARAPCAVPGSTPRCCACGRRCAASPSRCRARRPARPTRSRPASQATLGAARNVACAGGEPIGLTDCLNFGNPEKPEIALGARPGDRRDRTGGGGARNPGRLRQRLALQRGRRRPIPPTPVVGCVGLVPDVRARPGALAARRRRPPRDVARRLARRRGGAHQLPLEGGAAPDALPRRRRAAASRSARGSRRVERRPRGRRRAPGTTTRAAAPRSSRAAGADQAARLARLRPDRSGA